MTKTSLMWEDGEQKRKKLSLGSLVKVGSLLVAGGVFWSLQRHASWDKILRWSPPTNGILETGGEIGKIWRWHEVNSSADLEWHPCYDEYDCARLDVPLDWLDESDQRRATLAIIRYNATDKENYKGPVFINPGGPGGSGIWFVKHLAPYYQLVVGRNHDIISFDPRGVGATIPSISCWNLSSTTSEFLWSMLETPVLDAYPGALYEAYARASAFSQQCLPHVQEAGKYLSTASVARDMLHIVEKIGEQKLKYWGFSYGTFIGATFAALFPDKIDRMVNDGNVDAVEFSSGVGTHFLTDTDAVMDAFYTFCHQAGPDLCAMYDVSPLAIRKRLDAIFEDIKIHPVIVPASPSLNSRPEIVNYSRLRRLVASALYRPLLVFPMLADIIAALEQGDGRPFVELTSPGGEELALCDAGQIDPGDPEPESPEVEGSADGGIAVLCTDAAPILGGVEAFGKYLTVLEGISHAAGGTMAEMALACADWGVKAKWRFDGPFEGITSHPILFIANTADNVTPLRSALQNAKGFPGSVTMIQDSYGHTSLSTPSRCTVSKIRTYFQTGELPPPNTVCAPDLVPFEKWNFTALASMSAEEIEVEMAMRKLMMAPVFGSKFHAPF